MRLGAWRCFCALCPMCPMCPLCPLCLCAFVPFVPLWPLCPCAFVPLCLCGLCALVPLCLLVCVLCLCFVFCGLWFVVCVLWFVVCGLLRLFVCLLVCVHTCMPRIDKSQGAEVPMSLPLLTKLSDMRQGYRSGTPDLCTCTVSVLVTQ